MCAIFGFIRRKKASAKAADVVKNIVRGNIHRGDHAFGMAWIDTSLRLKAFKSKGNLTRFPGVIEYAATEAMMLIGHLRWATHGSPEENINNHPHAADGGWIVHNGIVGNYDHLIKIHDLLPTTECDSEVLGLMIENSEGRLRDRCVAAINAVDDGSPLAMLGLWARPAYMVIARRGNPLHYATTSEGTYFASLPSGLPGKVFRMKDNSLVTMNAAMKGSVVNLDPPPVGRSWNRQWQGQDLTGICG